MISNSRVFMGRKGFLLGVNFHLVPAFDVSAMDMETIIEIFEK